MTDYSQYGEQAAILDAFGRCAECNHDHGMHSPHCVFTQPRFLDIGAWHPTIFSNTRALYELGWSGVLVEPSPGPVLSLLTEYHAEPRIQIVAGAVALPGWPRAVPITVTDDGTSSADEATVSKWRELVQYRGVLHVATVTLESISAQFGHFAFWNIDAEGMSAEIFKRMIELEYRPHCVCVEHDGRIEELLTVATAVGYKCTMTNGTNMVVVR